MPLRDYAASRQTLVDATPFVVATSLSYEERYPSAGWLKGTVLFADGSQLDMQEFLLIYPTLQIIKYGYHYRIGRRLIFRYDKANDPAARHLPTFPSHKHGSADLVASSRPSLAGVLHKILSQVHILQ